MSPATMLARPSQYRILIACRGCDYELTKEMVAIRLEATKKMA